ncbi:MAG: prepilin-type N-terminal cleavage/methylation domain-containing protein [Planctomycetes bacterium]|nr:prepilin-type N-terminal cleavage/methylation domain-containing protein [Planctomycetota bacterium]
MMRRNPAPARAGFTLAEVLVAILIMGGILVSVTQILNVARLSRDNIHNIQETQLAGPAIMDMIERDIRGIVIYNRTKQDHFRVQNRVLRGVDADSLDFVTTTDNLVLHVDGDRFLRSSVNEVGYRLRPNPDTDDFLELYRREDMGIDDKPFEGGEFTFLHDRVKNFDIQVFEEDGPDADPFEEWGGAEDEEHVGLPARIEISLTLELQHRIEREALRPNFLTEMTYRRIIRLPEALRIAEELIPVPTIPSGPSGSASANGGASGTDADDKGTKPGIQDAGGSTRGPRGGSERPSVR